MDRRSYLHDLVIQVLPDLELKACIHFLNSKQASPDLEFKA